jgi:hypothetical protein
MRNVLLERAPEPRRETQVGYRAKLVEDLSIDFRPVHVVDYYWGLRTLTNAWALAGNFDVLSAKKLNRDNTPMMVKMMPLDVASNYADRCLRLAMSCVHPPNEVMLWLERCDLLTRTPMQQLVSERWPAGEALTEAIDKANLDWAQTKNRGIVSVHHDLADAASASATLGIFSGAGMPQQHAIKAGTSALLHGSPLDDDARAQRPPKRDRDDGNRSKGKGKDGKNKDRKYKVGQMSSTHKGEKLCGAFNSKHGCSSRDERKCPKGGSHKCCYIMDTTGNACLSRDHGFYGH